jgi:hypothetical protein
MLRAVAGLHDQAELRRERFPGRNLRMPHRYAGTVRAPEFPTGLEWFNSPPLTLSMLRGKFVLLDFWTFG